MASLMAYKKPEVKDKRRYTKSNKRKHSNRIHTRRSSTVWGGGRGLSWQRPPLERAWDQRQEVTSYSPLPWTDWQTGVKHYLAPKFRLRAVIRHSSTYVHVILRGHSGIFLQTLHYTGMPILPTSLWLCHSILRRNSAILKCNPLLTTDI